jgi:hypothetical protein
MNTVDGAQAQHSAEYAASAPSLAQAIQGVVTVCLLACIKQHMLLVQQLT